MSPKLAKHICTLIFAACALASNAQPANYYWDLDGANPGPGGSAPAGTWDGTTASWSLSADGSTDPVTWSDGNVAVFAAGSDATGAYGVSVANTVTADSLQFEEGTVTLSGAGINLTGSGGVNVATGISAVVNNAIGGSVGVNKLGAGLVSLGAANTYTGGTVITAGTLQLANANRIPDASAVSVASGATFDLNNFSEMVGSLSGAGTVSLGGGSLYAGMDNTSTTYTGSISGFGKLLKIGTGTLTVTGASSFSGGVTVSGGVLSFPGESSAVAGDPNPLGAAPSVATAGYLTISGGATLRSTKTGAGGSFVLANRGILMGSGGGNLEVTSATAGDYLIYSGIIAGSGTVTKSGAGTLYLSAANTYTGNTTNLAGTLRIGASSVLGSTSSSTLVLAGGNLSSSVDANVYVQNKMLMTGNTLITGTPTNSYRAVVFGNASITTSGGTLTIQNVGGAEVNFQVRFTNGGFNFNRPIVITSSTDHPAQLDLLSDNLGVTAIADQTFSGVISGSGTIRRTSAGDGTGGKSILSGANTYSGGTTLNGGFIGFGVDSVGSPVTSGPIGKGTLTVGQDGNDGFFASGGARTVGNTIAFSTGTNITIIGANALTMSGGVTLPAAATSFNVSNTALTTFSGVIGGGAAGGTFIKAGPGTLAFSGANTYLANTLISAGAFLVNNTTGSGTGTGTVTANSGTYVGGTGRISGSVVLNNGSKLTPGAGTNATIGLLTMQGGLTMSNGGTYVWELNANNTASPGVNFDQLAMSAGSLVLGGASKLAINFTGSATVPNLSNAFWQVPHSWTLISLSGTAANPGGKTFATVSSSQYPTLKYITVAADGGGNIVLTYDPTSPFYALSDVGAGFFGGENVALTNSPGLGLSVWSSTRGGLSVTNWTLEGLLGELPLNDGSGNSRYSMTLTPSSPLVYYIVAKSTAAPYMPTVPAQWITTDDFGNYTVFSTNVAINAGGVLDLPVPPDIMQQPASKVVLSGKSANFSVLASSYSPLSYQWYVNGSTPLLNATNSTLTLGNVAVGNVGSYSVLITNVHGSTDSAGATLTVQAPPQLTAQHPGNGVQFSGPAIPGDTYWVQATTNLNPPANWVTLVTNVVGTNGLVQFSDTNATTQPSRYFRLVFP